MTKKYIYIASILALTPVVTYAAGKDLRYIIDTIVFYLNQVLVLMIGVAVVIFIYNIIKYFIVADANRADSGKYVMFSLIGFFVVLSFWGLVNIIQNTFDLSNEKNQPASWTSFKNIFPGGSSSVRYAPSPRDTGGGDSFIVPESREQDPDVD